jgi:hypothetical protein
MQYIKYKQIGILALLFSSFFTACEVDTLKEVTDLEQTVSLVQTNGGSVSLNADAVIIDKQKRMFRKGFGLALSGFQTNKGFSAELELVYDQVLENTAMMTAGQCFLTASKEDDTQITSLTVPAGSQQKIFYLNITEDALIANEGKTLCVKLKVKNLSAYTLNTLDSTFITLNTQDFASKKTDITYDYFLNTTFARDPAEPNERFDKLKDWIANDAITQSRPSGAGYDDNAGFMGIERWGSGDSPITNGKIYQTFKMPAGRYSVEVQMRKVDVDPGTYFVVARGNTLPDANAVGTAVNAVELSTAGAEKLLPVDFELNTEQDVAVGFLINITGTQKILQASGIKMYRLETFFD